MHVSSVIKTPMDASGNSVHVDDTIDWDEVMAEGLVCEVIQHDILGQQVMHNDIISQQEQSDQQGLCYFYILVTLKM